MRTWSGFLGCAFLLLSISLIGSCNNQERFIGSINTQSGTSLGRGGWTEEIFSFGNGRGELGLPQDYLFVMDVSVSMKSIINKVQRAFNDLATDVDTFPVNSRLALTYAMPADPNNFDKLHPSVKSYMGMEYEPGFLRLVDTQGVIRYREKVPTRAKYFANDACEPWFQPRAINDDGLGCLLAALQSDLYGYDCESGRTSYVQLNRKKKGQGERLFREGAFVSIIYVSDTHDPGCSSVDLAAHRPNYETLEAETYRTSPGISGFRVNGVVPLKASTVCNEALWGLSYLNPITLSQGVAIDSCVTEDYRSVISKIASSTALVTARFELKGNLKKILTVMVNGRELSPGDYGVDGNRVILSGLNRELSFQIIVRYEQIY